jgi:hypothetical protein
VYRHVGLLDRHGRVGSAGDCVHSNLLFSGGCSVTYYACFENCNAVHNEQQSNTGRYGWWIRTVFNPDTDPAFIFILAASRSGNRP